MPQIRLDSVSKYFMQEGRKNYAIRQVDLTIEQGEFIFVTGSSGAGKSTLLKLITGEFRPDQGKAYVNNMDVVRLARWGLLRRRNYFGYVPQLPQLIRRRTIGQNLEQVIMANRRRLDGTVEERVQKALAMVGLRDVIDRYPVELSQGQCRQVELARAIITSPPILVLDELTANLDEDAIWDSFHLLEELNHRGTTVIMATHAKMFVNMMRKRVITLVDGSIFGDVPKGRYGDVLSNRDDGTAARE